MKTTEYKNPKVSIVIPVYNGEKYIRFALESALAQTYDNLEILVVNDGSTDSTESIVQSYDDERIKYIKKENGGVSSALNLAIKEMKGEYFSWLSHDDTYEPNKVEREISFLKENHYIGKKIIVFSDYYLIDEKGKQIAECKKPHLEIEKKPEYALLKGHVNGLSLLIPKTAFQEYGEFNTEMKCVQDYDMWHRMSKTYKFIHIPDFLVSTRYHSKQVSNTSPKVVTEGNIFYETLLKELTKKRMAELEGSEYCFMREFAEFYKTTPYDKVQQDCANRAKELFNDAKQEVAHKKVSVIIPFYNREEKLLRAIRSVLGQTHKNLEIILVDDGSDKPYPKIQKIINENRSIIKLIKLERNAGPSIARNAGIKEATGDYLAFLDSDDEFVENKLETQLQYVVAAKARFSHTSYTRDMNGEQKVIHSGSDTGHCERKLVYSCPIATPTVIIDRQWLIEENIFFPEDIEIGEDTIFWLKLMKDNTFLVGIDKPLTIVHVGDHASAYTDEKQMIGLKNIIKFVITDDYYSQFDYELTHLMSGYLHYARKCFKEPEPIVGGNIFQKFYYYAKHEGGKSVIKRVCNKAKKTLQGNKD